MNIMSISEGQDNLIRTKYQEISKKIDEYRIMLRSSAMFKQVCIDCSIDFDHK